MGPSVYNERTYATAIKAQIKASSILPKLRAGWKYVTTVATICFPSPFPRNLDIAGVKVAKLAKTYAMEHLRIPIPLIDVQYAYHIQSCSFVVAHDAELRLPLVARLRGSRGVLAVALFLELLMYRRVNALLTRSPL